MALADPLQAIPSKALLVLANQERPALLNALAAVPAASNVAQTARSGAASELAFDAAALGEDVERDVIALWLAARDSRTPWYAKLIAAAVAAYALSPIDLIPDFVPVLGYLDDIIIVPLGILLVLKFIPSDLMTEFRAEAVQIEERPKSYAGAAIVVTLWIGAALLILWLLWPRHVLAAFHRLHHKECLDFTLNSESTYTWTNDEWSVPINFMVAKLLKFGNQPVVLTNIVESRRGL